MNEYIMILVMVCVPPDGVINTHYLAHRLHATNKEDAQTQASTRFHDVPNPEHIFLREIVAIELERFYVFNISSSIDRRI